MKMLKSFRAGFPVIMMSWIIGGNPKIIHLNRKYITNPKTRKRK